MVQLSTYLKTPQSTLFWNTYGDVFRIQDKNFDATNVHTVFTKTKTYFLTKKVYDLFEEFPTLLLNYRKQVKSSNLILYLQDICKILM